MEDIAKIFGSLFGKYNDAIKYNLSVTAGGYADDLKVICDHFTELCNFFGCNRNEKGHGFQFCRTGCYNIIPNNKKLELIVLMLSFMITNICAETIHYKTKNKIINKHVLRDIIATMISKSLCKKRSFRLRERRQHNYILYWYSRLDF
jgi:hypothetical protein